MQLTVEQHALHGLLLVKSAISPPEEARLRWEVSVLRAVGVPGLVELIDHDAGPGTCSLRARHVGTRTVLTLHDRSPRAVARLGAGVAATLADLHGRGVSHNAVEASHVLLAGDGAPVLCSLGRAGIDVGRWAGRLEPGPDAAAFDPGGDVRALAQLLAQLSATSRDWRELWPRRRLTRLLEAARHGEPAPTAAQLAAALNDLGGRSVPGPQRARDAELPVDLDPPTRSFGPAPPAAATPERSPRRRLLGTVAVVAVLAGAATAGAARQFGSPREAAGASPPSPTVDQPGPPETSIASPDPTPPPPACPQEHDDAAAGIPSTCAGGVTVDGRAVRLGPLAWELGEEGDTATVADLDCDGLLEAVLVRPSSSEVFVFRSWAPPGSPVTVTGSPVDGGVVSARPGPEGCGLLVSQPDGGEVALQPADLG